MKFYQPSGKVSGWQPLGEGPSIILTAPIPDSRIYSCGGDTILREVKKWMREISL